MDSPAPSRPRADSAPAAMDETPSFEIVKQRYLSSAAVPRTPSASNIDPSELPAPGTTGGGLWQQVTDLRLELAAAQCEMEMCRKRAADKELESRAQREDERLRREQAEREAAEVETLRAQCARSDAGEPFSAVGWAPSPNDLLTPPSLAEAAAHRAATETVRAALAAARSELAHAHAELEKAETLASAHASATHAMRLELDEASGALAEQLLRTQELSVALSSSAAETAATAAELEAAGAENARMAAELAHVAAARADMQAAWERLTAAFAAPPPPPGLC